MIKIVYFLAVISFAIAPARSGEIVPWLDDSEALVDYTAPKDGASGDVPALNPESEITFAAKFTPSRADLDEQTGPVVIIEVGGVLHGSGLYICGGELVYAVRTGGDAPVRELMDLDNIDGAVSVVLGDLNAGQENKAYVSLNLQTGMVFSSVNGERQIKYLINAPQSTDLTGNRTSAFLGKDQLSIHMGGLNDNYTEPFLDMDNRQIFQGLQGTPVRGQIFDQAVSPPEPCSPSPENGSDARVSLSSFSWAGGMYANSYNVYLGTSLENVTQADSANHFGTLLHQPQISGPDLQGRFELGLTENQIYLDEQTTYYWKVEAINSGYAESPWQGQVWAVNTDPLRDFPLTASGDLPFISLSWERPADLLPEMYPDLRYDVLIASDSSFEQIVSSVSGINQTSWQPNTQGMFFGENYYCRVDCFSPSHPDLEGSSEVLELSYENPGIIEDFDQYSSDTELLADWQDGTTNSTGSLIELGLPAYGKSLKLSYQNQNGTEKSAVGRSFNQPKDFTACGTQILEFYFRGEPENQPADFYVQLEDSGGVSGKAYLQEDLIYAAASRVRIKLEEFSNEGVNISEVAYLEFGLENSPSQTASGVISIDSIALDIKRCLEGSSQPADINNDCLINLQDLQILAENWLAQSHWVFAAAEEPEGLEAYYPFDETSGAVAYDNSANSYHADVLKDAPDTAWNPSGVEAGCLELDGTFAVELPSGIFDAADQGFTISFWFLDQPDAWETRNSIDFLIAASSADFEKEAEYEFAVYPDFQAGWHHLCITNKTGGFTKIYKDGVLAAEGETSLTSEDYSNAGRSFIGSSPSGDGEFLKAKIDEFRIYSRSLSQEEVVFLYGGAMQLVMQPVSPVICPKDPLSDGVINIGDFNQIALFWQENFKH
ncbi:LamG domain-containing protein [Sedimentisphaera salicampi]|uniref:LamG domain-containing protein n=1 Tax=Sedimentisphaera salicampi TaxID=1941349 RepID=UPI000B9B2D27|nr:LamG domain-containing protein [Sedimentisphaera salicampi]OXU15609.1 hypothetical protein SMSP1_00692 [Sedimentisphaera salicampi]